MRYISRYRFHCLEQQFLAPTHNCIAKPFLIWSPMVDNDCWIHSSISVDVPLVRKCWFGRIVYYKQPYMSVLWGTPFNKVCSSYTIRPTTSMVLRLHRKYIGNWINFNWSDNDQQCLANKMVSSVQKVNLPSFLKAWWIAQQRKPTP